jgi:CubicO group peptidase (beta-lactamase class C family)
MKRLCTFQTCQCLLVCILSITGMTSVIGSTLPEERKQAIDRFVGQFVAFAMFDGTILIDIAGETVYEQSFGHAQVEQGVRHNANTRFRLASVSKAITDAALARMMNDGVFTMDTPISRYLPDFPSAGDITIRHLIEHTSGIPHTNALPWGDGTVSLSIDEIVSRLSQLPLDFTPGEDARYSNGGYAVAARILELAGNGTYSEVMRATVFEPLGMSNTDHITDARTPIPNMATGYEPGLLPGERRHPRYYAFESRPGGGSLYSTAGDMLRFVRAVFRDDFIPEKFRREVMGENDKGYRTQGRAPGFVAKIQYDSLQDMIVISLGNSYSVPTGWTEAIATLATGSSDDVTWPDLQAAKPTVGHEDPRIGRYLSASGTPTIITRVSGGVLMIEGSNGARNAAIPLIDGSFLQPLYFQRCQQNPENRIIICKMLSGDERFTNTLEPAEH